MKKLAVKLNPASERMVKKKHPWVFDKGIKQIKGNGKSGDLAIIFNSDNNKFLACGLYDPDSPIRIKLLQFHKPASIDETWFKAKVLEAYYIRKPLLKTNTNAYRLIFGENDGLPSLIADVYDGVLVLKLYSAIWLPYIEILKNILKEVAQVNCIVLRLGRSAQSRANLLGFMDGDVLYGELITPDISFIEHGIHFKANVIKGHKTGFFLDHRHNRKRVGELTKDKTVLDVFSYAGGFSVHALAGGASEVTSVDLSKKALELAQENAQLNKHNGEHITLAGDAFEILNNLINQNNRFDLVIIDPPSFAKQKTEVEGAIRSYVRLTKLGVKLVEKGGILMMASCSSRVSKDVFFETVESVFFQNQIKFKRLETTFHDIDHPIGFSEGAYLKAAYYQLG